MPNHFAAWLAERRKQRRLRNQDVRDIDGFRVVVENPYPHIENEVVVGRLRAALELIREFQPVRYRHLQRDVSQFWITRHPARGVYFPRDATVLTEITFLHRVGAHPDAEVASSILHEGVHARIARMGRRFGFRRQWSSADEERICRRAEVAFGRALPATLGAPVLDRAEPVLESDVADVDVAPQIDWRQAHLNKYIADLEDLSVPPWLQRPLVGWMRFRLRRVGAV